MAASAGSFYSSYRLDFSLLDQDIAAAKQRLADLTAFAARPVPVSAGAGQASGRAPAADAQAAADQRAANAALGLAQAEARLAVAQGDTTRALSILNTGLDTNAGASQRAILSVQTQVARLESGTGVFTQFGAAAKSSLLGIVGPAAAAGIAIGAVRAAIGEAEEGFKLQASLDASRQSINLLLAGVRNSNEVWAGATRFANEYKLTQQETNDAIQASIRIIRSSRSPMEDILGAFARLRVLAPEKTFQDASRALSELQAGQVVSIEHLFNVPRADANAMKKEIEGGADAVQVLNRYLDKTGVTMDAVKAQSQGAAGALKELAQSSERFSLALGGGSGGPGLAIVQARITATDGATRLLTGDVQAMGQSLVQAAHDGTAAFGILQGAFPGFGAAIRGMADETIALQGATRQAAGATDQYGGSIGAEIAQAQAAAPAHALFAASVQQVTAAMSEDAVMLQQVGVQTDAATTAAQQHANALAVQTQRSMEASLQTQQLTQFQATLANLSGQVAGGLISDANAAAILARQYGITSGEAARLIGLQAQLAGATRARQTALDRDELQAARRNAAAPAPQSLALLEDQKRRTDELAAAEGRLAAARGNTAGQIAALRRQQQGLSETSAEYINIQAQIESIERKNAAAGTARGAAKLSDQQKLNNTLLADQQRFANQMEDLERDHYKKQLDIQRDFERRSLEQQRANELSKRSSELDYLKAITSSELNSTKEGRVAIQRINERFYADFQAAQEAAQAGNAKQSEEMVNQAKHRADIELQYAQAIEEARKNKNAGEVARLEAILERERQLLDEQSKQIAEGGDANVKARDEAMSAEQQRYEDAQGKIVTASGRAADAKIDNADRSGKAIDAENTKLREQDQLYARIGARAGGGASAPTTPGAAPLPPPSVGAGPATPAASGGEQLWRVFDSAVVDAIGAQTQTLGGKIDATNGLLSGLIGRVQAVEGAVRGLQGRFAQ